MDEIGANHPEVFERISEAENQKQKEDQKSTERVFGCKKGPNNVGTKKVWLFSVLVENETDFGKTNNKQSREKGVDEERARGNKIQRKHSFQRLMG